MATRNYGQACSVAHFLDRLGSRWYLLIIRDLLIGPRRFSPLLDGLPGIGTNRLTNRLSELQELNIVRKAKDAHANVTVYELTESGQNLEPVILSMARWGLHYLREDSSGQVSRPDLLVVAFRAAFNPDHAKGIREVYEFRIDETVFFVEIDDGKIRSGLGAAKNAAFVFIANGETFNAIVGGGLSPAEAEMHGALEIIGDHKAFDRCLRMFTA
jgi:DNA-binding HxlR family transcriptional regulator